MDEEKRRVLNRLSAKKSRQARRSELENLRLHFKVANETIQRMMGTIEELRARLFEGGGVDKEEKATKTYYSSLVGCHNHRRAVLMPVIHASSEDVDTIGISTTMADSSSSDVPPLWDDDNRDEMACQGVGDAPGFATYLDRFE